MKIAFLTQHFELLEAKLFLNCFLKSKILKFNTNVDQIINKYDSTNLELICCSRFKVLAEEKNFDLRNRHELSPISAKTCDSNKNCSLKFLRILTMCFKWRGGRLLASLRLFYFKKLVCKL